MNISIKGYQATSFSDYPGHISAVVFTGGCNLRCLYCQNADLVLRHHEMKTMPPEEMLEKISSKKRWLDAIVLSGGEPLMHEGAGDFLVSVKSLGLKTAVETNGHYPENLKSLIDSRCLDFVAMDIKAPLQQNLWLELTGKEANVDKVEESMKIIETSGLPYEYRLTVYPGFHTEDMIQNIRSVAGENLKLQEFRPEHVAEDIQSDIIV